MMTLNELVRVWVEARNNLAESERLEREAFHKMSKAFNDSGLSVDRSGTVKSSRSVEVVEWGDWKVGDTVIFDGYTDDGLEHWPYTIGKEYKIEACDGYTGPLDDDATMPYANYGFRFIRP